MRKKDERIRELLEKLSTKDIDNAKRIMDVIDIRLSASVPPHIIYTPFQEFPNDILRHDVLRILRFLDKNFNALGLGEIVGPTLEAQEVCVRVPDDKAQYENVKKAINKKYKQKNFIPNIKIPRFEPNTGNIIWRGEICHIAEPGDYQHHICKELFGVDLKKKYRLGESIGETYMEDRYEPLGAGIEPPYKNPRWIKDAVYKINEKFNKKFGIKKIIEYKSANLRVMIEIFEAK